jgi:hypothetical protein
MRPSLSSIVSRDEVDVRVDDADAEEEEHTRIVEEGASTKLDTEVVVELALKPLREALRAVDARVAELERRASTPDASTPNASVPDASVEDERFALDARRRQRRIVAFLLLLLAVIVGVPLAILIQRYRG